jgi:hypothetical protein
LLLLAACGVSSDVSRTIGARCDEMDDCAERCLPTDDYPGGFCSLSCLDDADCPDGTACIDDDGGVCLVPCTGDDGCEYLGEGWGCAARRATTGEEVMVCRGD